MNSKNYIFDFTVPQGPTGPTGPAGNTGLPVYGGRYSTIIEVLNLAASSAMQVPLLDFSASREVDYSTANSIIIEEEGVYEISYVLDASISNSASLTVVARENGSAISGTKITKTVSSQTSTTFCGNALYTLAKGSVIDLLLLLQQQL